MMDTLFEGYEAPLRADENLSADRRRTLRQRMQVENGIHPLTGLRARPDLGTCGDCRFRTLVGWHDRSYPKCGWFPESWSADEYVHRTPPRATHGAASDVRAWWPACDQHELGDPKMGPDAARWTP